MSMSLRVSRDRAVAPLAVVGAAYDKRGTEVTFLPSKATKPFQAETPTSPANSLSFARTAATAASSPEHLRPQGKNREPLRAMGCRSLVNETDDIHHIHEFVDGVKCLVVSAMPETRDAIGAEASSIAVIAAE
jgi:hypothetical protein